MPRPGNFYRGEERSGRFGTLLAAVVVILFLLAAFLLYALQSYVVYEKDGLRVVLPSERSESEATASLATGSVVAAPLLADVEIVVDKTDYSGVVTTAGAELKSIQARYVPAESMTAATLDGFVTGMGDYNALVLEVKPESGLLCYASAVRMANSYGVSGTLDLRAYAEKLKEKGVYLAAQVSGLTDSAMAARYSPIALKSAVTGGVFTSDGRAWLDPYSQETRDYLTALMRELRDMGFDEILLSGVWLPDSEFLQFSSSMTVTPEKSSAVSSFALYLRDQAEDLGLKLSGMAESGALRRGESLSIGQDLPVLFKAFDRVAFMADAYDASDLMTALRTALDAGYLGDRVLPVSSGYIPESASYAVR